MDAYRRVFALVTNVFYSSLICKPFQTKTSFQSLCATLQITSWLSIKCVGSHIGLCWVVSASSAWWISREVGTPAIQGANGNLGEEEGFHPTEALESGNRNQADMAAHWYALSSVVEFWSHETPLNGAQRKAVWRIISR